MWQLCISIYIMRFAIQPELLYLVYLFINEESLLDGADRGGASVCRDRVNSNL